MCIPIGCLNSIQLYFICRVTLDQRMIITTYIIYIISYYDRVTLGALVKNLFCRIKVTHSSGDFGGLGRIDRKFSQLYISEGFKSKFGRVVTKSNFFERNEP